MWVTTSSAALADAHSSTVLVCREFSLADIVYTPAMERLGANLPVMRNFPLRHHPSFPHIAQWYAALDERPAYQRVKSDDMTHNLVFRSAALQPDPQNPAFLQT